MPPDNTVSLGITIPMSDGSCLFDLCFSGLSRIRGVRRFPNGKRVRFWVHVEHWPALARTLGVL